MHVENDRRNQMQQRVVNPNIRLESYIDSGLCASKNLFHIDTNLLGKRLFRYRINYCLHWFRTTSRWHLSTQHLACHTQGWDIWIKWMTVGMGYQAAERAFAIHRTHRNNWTSPVWLRKLPWSLRGQAQAQGHEDLLLQLDFWREGGRWGQASLNRTLLNTSQLL